MGQRPRALACSEVHSFTLCEQENPPLRHTVMTQLGTPAHFLHETAINCQRECIELRAAFLPGLTTACFETAAGGCQFQAYAYVNTAIKRRFPARPIRPDPFCRSLSLSAYRVAASLGQRKRLAQPTCQSYTPDPYQRSVEFAAASLWSYSTKD